MSIATTSKLLLDEDPVLVLPSLAVKIGLNESIVLQQLHYWVVKAVKKKQLDRLHDGRYWVYNTYEDWRAGNFPWWSAGTIQRIFLKLEKLGVVIARHLSKNKSDRKKYYTIDYDKLAVIDRPHSHKLLPSTSQVVTMHHINVRRWNVTTCCDGYTETTQRLPETKETAPAIAAQPPAPKLDDLKKARDKKLCAFIEAYWTGLDPAQRPRQRNGAEHDNPYKINPWRTIAGNLTDQSYGPEDVSRWLTGFALKVPVGEEKFRGVGKYIGKVIHLADVAREMPAWIKANPASGSAQNGTAAAEQDEAQTRLFAENARRKAERERLAADDLGETA